MPKRPKKPRRAEDANQAAKRVLDAVIANSGEPAPKKKRPTKLRAVR
jgi:hypothetical protein